MTHRNTQDTLLYLFLAACFAILGGALWVLAEQFASIWPVTWEIMR